VVKPGKGYQEYLQFTLEKDFKKTFKLVATTKGGVVARKEFQVECTIAGDPPADLPSPPEAKSCSECAADVTSRICVDSKYI